MASILSSELESVKGSAFPRPYSLELGPSGRVLVKRGPKASMVGARGASTLFHDPLVQHVVRWITRRNSWLMWQRFG